MGFSGSRKRAREEEEEEKHDHGPPTAASRRHHSRTAAPPPADGPLPTVTAYDALRFVAAVKREFAGEPDKYQEFLAVLREFRRGSLDIASAMDSFQVVLHGHPELIRGFNAFLPKRGGLEEEQQGGDADA
ncbi:unnamed protein product [Urochloa decumbens]|uniref:Uncharacterized protein n=1 Tax=Urochloa decumbens TaxID=240449 RepID=A0ABC9BKD0_9POAL